MTVLTKFIYRLSAISVKNPIISVAEMDKLILKFVWECKRPRIAKTILKNKVGGLRLTDIKTYYKATVIKSVILEK